MYYYMIESLLSNSKDNGHRMISFAVSNVMTVGSTTFPHRDIHKHTCRSPDVKTLNQIDHVMIQNSYRRIISDIQNHRAADCDTDHYLVIKKCRLKLKKQTKLRRKKKSNIILDSLKDENIRKNYVKTLNKTLWVDTRNAMAWESIKHAIQEAANLSIR